MSETGSNRIVTQDDFARFVSDEAFFDEKVFPWATLIEGHGLANGDRISGPKFPLVWTNRGGRVDSGQDGIGSDMKPPDAALSNRSNRADTVFDELRELIVDGRIVPGGRIVETDLMERMGVSRAPVRTALYRLEQEGLVARLDGARTRWVASSLTSQDVRELNEIMGALEGVAGRHAALLDPEPRRELVAELRAINDELRELRGADAHRDGGRLAELHCLFHVRYARSSAGPRLLRVHEMFQPQVARYIRTYIVFMAQMGSLDEHEDIISAIERGDRDAAEAAIRRHWDGGADRYARAMESLGEKGGW